MTPRFLPFGDEGAVAGRREEAADARAARADALGERALRHQLDLDLAGEELPLELLVLADVGRDHLPDLPRLQQNADAEVVDAGVVADDGEACRAARVQRANEVFGDAAQAEAAHHDRRAVGDLGHCLPDGRSNFVHRDLFLVRSSSPAAAPRRIFPAAFARVRSSRSSVRTSMSVSRPLRDLVRIGRRDILPDVGRARGQTRRVHEPASRQRKSIGAHRIANDLHQCAGGELRQMAEKRQRCGRGPTRRRPEAPRPGRRRTRGAFRAILPRHRRPA